MVCDVVRLHVPPVIIFTSANGVRTFDFRAARAKADCFGLQAEAEMLADRCRMPAPCIDESIIASRLVGRL
jgi:hypothetical protein